MVYVVVTAGLAFTLLPVVALNPVAGDHVNTSAPVTQSTVESPRHIDAELLHGVTTGNGLTVTVTFATDTQLLESVMLTE